MYFSGCSNQIIGLVAFQVQIYFPINPITYTTTPLECLFITANTKGIKEHWAYLLVQSGEKQTVFEWLVVYKIPSLPDDILGAVRVKNAICPVVKD